jgi:hypothetical protein
LWPAHRASRLSRAGSTRVRFPTSPRPKYFRLSIQLFALASFIIMCSSDVFAQGTTANNWMDKLQPGQTPYFDAVPDPSEGLNRGFCAMN